MLLDLVGQARGLLDARPGLGAEVQADFAGIDSREEIPPEERYQGQRRQAGHGEQQHDPARTLQPGVQQALVAIAQAVERDLEAALEALRAIGLQRLPVTGARRSQQVHRQRRHQGA